MEEYDSSTWVPAAADREYESLSSGTEKRLFLDETRALSDSRTDQHLLLPQIVVVGDQSSGKSSVLQALTNIPFPTSTGTCTRYATQVNLRRHHQSLIKVDILADPDSIAEEKQRIAAFNHEQSVTGEADLVHLETLFENASKAIFPSKAQHGFFSKHVLNIHISGPTQPDVNVVDLPGLFHAVTPGHTEEIAAIFALARTYMKNNNTIILPIINGSNDIANQMVLQMVKEVDKKGTRTLGIITKPDMVLTETRESEFINLANNGNNQNKLELGWHVLRNKSYEEGHFTKEQRDRAETVFFSGSNWEKKLGPNKLGVDALSSRLVTHVIPHIIEAMRLESGHQGHQVDEGSTATEAESYADTLRHAVRGHYNLPDHQSRQAPARQVCHVSSLRQSGSIDPEECRLCRNLLVLWIVLAVGSLSVGLWRSVATGDEGKGFTDAAYVVAVGGLVVFPIQTRHNQRCRRSIVS